jgi:hypothetical protein
VNESRSKANKVVLGKKLQALSSVDRLHSWRVGVESDCPEMSHMGCQDQLTRISDQEGQATQLVVWAISHKLLKVAVSPDRPDCNFILRGPEAVPAPVPC